MIPGTGFPSRSERGHKRAAWCRHVYDALTTKSRRLRKKRPMPGVQSHKLKKPERPPPTWTTKKKKASTQAVRSLSSAVRPKRNKTKPQHVPTLRYSTKQGKYIRESRYVHILDVGDRPVKYLEISLYSHSRASSEVLKRLRSFSVNYTP